MFKKTFVSSMIFLLTASKVFASSTPYIGGGLAVGGYRSGSDSFQRSGVTGSVFGGTGKQFLIQVK